MRKEKKIEISRYFRICINFVRSFILDIRKVKLLWKFFRCLNRVFLWESSTLGRFLRPPFPFSNFPRETSEWSMHSFEKRSRLKRMRFASKLEWVYPWKTNEKKTSYLCLYARLLLHIHAKIFHLFQSLSSHLYLFPFWFFSDDTRDEIMI